MSFQQFVAFLLALMTFLSGKVGAVVGSTDAEPIVAAQREYRFDQDALLLGAYCFRVDEHFEETRAWFKDAGLQFSVAVSGNLLTQNDLDWFLNNRIGIIAPQARPPFAVRRSPFARITVTAIWLPSR